MSYIKKAERNLVNICKSFNDVMKITDALSHFGGNYCQLPANRDMFYEGMHKIRMALLSEHYRAESALLTFVAVGGKEAQDYSKKEFEKYFNEEERRSVMQFLDKYGSIPSSWRVEEEKDFRKEAKKKINENKNNE